MKSWVSGLPAPASTDTIRPPSTRTSSVHMSGQSSGHAVVATPSRVTTPPVCQLRCVDRAAIWGPIDARGEQPSAEEAEVGDGVAFLGELRDRRIQARLRERVELQTVDDRPARVARGHGE